MPFMIDIQMTLYVRRHSITLAIYWFLTVINRDNAILTLCNHHATYTNALSTIDVSSIWLVTEFSFLDGK